MFLGEGLSLVGNASPDRLEGGVGDGGEALSEAGGGAAGAYDAEADWLRLLCSQPSPPSPPYSVNNLLVFIDLRYSKRRKQLNPNELFAEYRF